MPQALISGNIMFFYGFFVVLVSVFCVETTTHTDALTPLNTSQNEEMMAPSSLMTYQATASLEKVNISRLLMSITPASARGRQIPLNFYRTTELQETMNEHSFKRRQPAMVRSATSPKPIIKQRVAAATAEKEATSKSTTVSTSRNFRKINLAESSGAVSTSLSTTPLSANGESSATPIANGESSKFFSNVQAAINQLMSTSGREVVRKLQQANISTDCSLGLLQFTRAIQDLQPWAMRLIDATGKYPTGSLQGTFADLGAYDECIETVVRDEYGTLKVRGQYCDVHLSILDQEILDQIVFPAILNYNKRRSVGHLCRSINHPQHPQGAQVLGKTITGHRTATTEPTFNRPSTVIHWLLCGVRHNQPPPTSIVHNHLVIGISVVPLDATADGELAPG
ncbi:uncharacterized protein LOC142777014 [Rhipicephalus microplus]|uniref:uncharacterized protein LOC142777014 n=1 Tax=Rhipicephalus microplus TaxID=6941 RepID=UPI003F6C01F5